MSKHEARISKTRFFLSLSIAVIISLSAGIGTGYLLAKISDVDNSQLLNTIEQNNSIKQPVVQHEEDKTKETEGELEEKSESHEVALTKQEQLDIVQSILKTYYSIDNTTYTKLLNQTLNQSKITGKSQDDLFREELYKVYQKVLTDKSLSDMKKFIYAGSLKDYYFSDFFNSKRDTKIKSIKLGEYKDNIIKAESEITNSFNYYCLPNSQDFFNKLKGKDISKQQYIRIISLDPDRIKVLETRKENFEIKKVEGKWLISSNSSQIVSTEIVEVVYHGKTWSFADFARRYLN